MACHRCARNRYCVAAVYAACGAFGPVWPRSRWPMRAGGRLHRNKKHPLEDVGLCDAQVRVGQHRQATELGIPGWIVCSIQALWRVRSATYGFEAAQDQNKMHCHAPVILGEPDLSCSSPDRSAGWVQFEPVRGKHGARTRHVDLSGSGRSSGSSCAEIPGRQAGLLVCTGALGVSLEANRHDMCQRNACEHSERCEHLLHERAVRA